jgi:hypothetical protein
MPLSGIASLLDVLQEGVFCPRETRDGGVVLVPSVIVCRKTAMRLFCGGKKGFNHDGAAMVWGCQMRLDADGNNKFE